MYQPAGSLKSFPVSIVIPMKEVVIFSKVLMMTNIKIFKSPFRYENIKFWAEKSSKYFLNSNEGGSKYCLAKISSSEVKTKFFYYKFLSGFIGRELAG